MAKSEGKNPAETHVSGQSNKPLSRPAHALSQQQVAEELGANILDGLTAAEAAQRLATFGKNDLGDAKGVQPLQIVIAQIANAMTMVRFNERVTGRQILSNHSGVPDSGCVQGG